jgi:steroid 5-alpha reductase family enzyme
MINFLFIMFVALFGTMTIAASIGILIKNTSIVDVFWGLGLAVAAGTLYSMLPHSHALSIFTILVVCWGLRLGAFLFFTRTLTGKQDRRYTEFEKKWGTYRNIRVFLHFYLQASLQLVLCFSFYPLYHSPSLTMGPIQYVAILIFIISLIGQTLADWQLNSYKSQGNHGIYRQGLWSISRHPNLFFECVMWVALAAYSLNYSGNIVAWISPLTVWIIIRLMTGPYTERLSLSKHKEVFQSYQNEVPMIVPKLLFFKNYKK